MIFLDRDGVLNQMYLNPEHGLVDSPLIPEHVTLISGVASALRRLTEAGERIVVVTNQPAAAKGKATRAHLEATHAKVLELAQSEGGKILDSYICWHRSEDKCECRKPKPGMLLSAWDAYGSGERATCWMVGDGITDVEAGKRFGARTVFLGPKKCDHCKVLEDRSLVPDAWHSSLSEWVEHYLRRK